MVPDRSLLRFHQVNSWEENNKIVLIVSRQDSAFGEGSGDYSNVGRLYKWTIDLDRGTVNEEPIDDRAGDFGRVNDSFVGLQSKYGYLMSSMARAIVRNLFMGQTCISMT